MGLKLGFIEKAIVSMGCSNVYSVEPKQCPKRSRKIGEKSIESRPRVPDRSADASQRPNERERAGRAIKRFMSPPGCENDSE